MSDEEVKVETVEDKAFKLKKILPQKRKEAIEYIREIYCINCKYKSDCTSREPDYLIICNYIEEWAIKHWNEVNKKKD
jgi:hypothetical protein